MEEQYELVPVSQLKTGDAIYYLGGRYEVASPPWHPEEMGAEWLRLPVRKPGAAERHMAPPEKRTHLVPRRTGGARSPALPYKPDLTRQDDTLIGVDIDALLMQIRTLVGGGELVDPELMRKLDSALSRGFPLPMAWRTAEYRKLITLVSHIESDLHGTLRSARRLGEELAERNHP